MYINCNGYVFILVKTKLLFVYLMAEFHGYNTEMSSLSASLHLHAVWVCVIHLTFNKYGDEVSFIAMNFIPDKNSST